MELLSSKTKLSLDNYIHEECDRNSILFFVHKLIIIMSKMKRKKKNKQQLRLNDLRFFIKKKWLSSNKITIKYIYFTKQYYWAQLFQFNYRNFKIGTKSHSVIKQKKKCLK